MATSAFLTTGEFSSDEGAVVTEAEEEEVMLAASLAAESSSPPLSGNASWLVIGVVLAEGVLLLLLSASLLLMDGVGIGDDEGEDEDECVDVEVRESTMDTLMGWWLWPFTPWLDRRGGLRLNVVTAGNLLFSCDMLRAWWRVRVGGMGNAREGEEGEAC